MRFGCALLLSRLRFWNAPTCKALTLGSENTEIHQEGVRRDRVGPMPPQFFAGVSMNAQRQQGFLAALFHLGSDEQPVAVDRGRTGPPTRQLHRPTYVLGLAPLRGEVLAVRHSVSVWPSPPGPIGIACRAGGPHAALESRPATGVTGRRLAIRDGGGERGEHTNPRMFHFNQYGDYRRLISSRALPPFGSANS
jgi:hypothetical protein